jgi:hypothetical protein
MGGPEWLKTKPVLSQFRNQNKHQAYRKKVQGYAKEEKRLLEDFTIQQGRTGSHCLLYMENRTTDQ